MFTFCFLTFIILACDQITIPQKILFIKPSLESDKTFFSYSLSEKLDYALVTRKGIQTLTVTDLDYLQELWMHALIEALLMPKKVLQTPTICGKKTFESRWMEMAITPFLTIICSQKMALKVAPKSM